MQVRIGNPKVYCILKVAHCVQAANPWILKQYCSLENLLMSLSHARTLYKQVMVHLLTTMDKTHKYRMPDTVAFCQGTQGRA